jgi:chromosome segregation ATPase
MGSSILGVTMTNSGSSVYDDLKSGASKLKRQEREYESELNSIEKQISELTNEREQSYVKLAHSYLPELSAESIKNTLSKLQSDVQQIFEEKQKRRKQLDTLIEESLSKKEKEENFLSDVTSKLNDRVSQRERLRKIVNDELSKNEEYQEILKKTEIAKEKMDGYKMRMSSFKSIAERDIDSYRENPIFMYLQESNFRSEEYKRRFGEDKRRVRKDTDAAKKINYSEQKKTYDLLTDMPEILQKRLQKRQQEIDGLIEILRNIEKHTEYKYELTPVLAEIEKLSNEKSNYQAHITKHNSDYDSFSQERRNLENKKGKYHQKAISELKKYLKGDSIHELKTLARSTPQSEDDRIVDRMEEIDAEIRHLKNNAKGVQEKREGISDKLKGLNRIISRYDNDNFDSSRSYFDSSFDVNSLITGYILGKISEISVWSRIENEHHRRPAETYRSSSYGGYSSSSSSSSWGSSSSSHSSSSGFGGGGHSSTGGF